VPDVLKRHVGLGLVLTCLVGTLAFGAAVKGPCASGDWVDGRQYRWFCYSDIEPLLGTEQLTGGRLPFIDPCVRAPDDTNECDEYPVVSMYAMRLAAWASNTLPGFFWANAVLLSLCAALVALCLYLMAGPRALAFALAPTLLVYGFMNWDLVTVAFATVATLAYVERRNVSSGVLLGLGAAAKVYPALLVVPFLLGRFRERDPDGGIHLAWAAAGTWIVVNVPFALASFSSWWEFFRFNAQRPADWDSLWFIVHHRLTGDLYFGATKLLNIGSAVLFVGVSIALYLARRAADPEFPRWTFGFPLIVAFLLTSKVYSPQYGLWLLPWFALVLPDLRLFVAFEVTDVAVFITRFSWFGRYGNFGGLPIGAFELAVAVRAVVLIVCIVSWLRSSRSTAEAVELSPTPAPA
jgi:Glycosyltransferase family 87